MKLEYIVNCKYYGVAKVYNKVFYSDKEYFNFKEWITHKKGYTNVKFLKKVVEDRSVSPLQIKLQRKNTKDKLKQYLLHNKKEVLFFKFIYCLIHNDEIVYVGKTINIQSRILEHKKDRTKVFDSFSVISQLPNEIPDNELLSLEEKYIKLLKPKYNIIHNKV
jgi:excinuclease UvrABC nuclease subunit